MVDIDTIGEVPILDAMLVNVVGIILVVLVCSDLIFVDPMGDIVIMRCLVVGAIVVILLHSLV